VHKYQGQAEEHDLHAVTCDNSERQKAPIGGEGLKNGTGRNKGFLCEVRSTFKDKKSSS
jgi:hypothetical protein